MNDMKFGVCYYDMDVYEPKVEDLHVYNTYDDAFCSYLDEIVKGFSKSHLFPKDLWVVFIKGDTIVQFERIETYTKSELVKIEK